MMGTEQDLAGLLRMRLLEHLLHTWDIDVALDDTATLPGDDAALVIEQLPLIVRYTAKPTKAQQIRVQTVQPELLLQLSLDPNGSQLETIEPQADAGQTSEQISEQTAEQTSEQTLQLPTEAFVRLVYGRLDADHTPPTVDAAADLLDTLRAALPRA
jgi:hypothetical protein